MHKNDTQFWCARSAELRNQGKLEDAVVAARRALELEPENAVALNQLAHALRRQGRLAEARDAAEQAVKLAPQLAAAWFNLGAARAEMGATEDGIRAYRKALEIDPAFAEAWSNLGGALGAQGDLAAEIDAYRRALDANPELAPVWSNLGNALREAGELEEAVTACRQALARHPGFAAAWNNLASALREQGKLAAAIDACEQALALAPQNAEAWSNLGNVLEAQGRFDEAIRAHERAVAMAPGHALVHFNLGLACKRRGDLEPAIASYRRALEIAPDHAGAHWNLSLALLTLGDLRRGWPEYEWRWRIQRADPRRYEFRQWHGEDSPGGRILLWGEQGIGDEILYASMVPDLLATGMAVTLETDPRLVTLFQRSFARARVVARRDPPAMSPMSFDYQAPLASLGQWRRPSFESFPRHTGYLQADARRVQHCRERLRQQADGTRLVVGISWKSRNEQYGADKSCNLADWAGVLKIPGVRFVDLQYGDTEGERRAVERAHDVAIHHFSDIDLYEDMEGLAALCAACDLVLTVSNVTTHVAGALGHPVWQLTAKAKGKIWYWFADRSASPWYPSLRIFTQRAAGSWREVLDEVARDLARKAV